MARPQLVPVGAGHYLAPAAAAAYLRMLADGCPTAITSSTRSWALQLDWFNHQGQPGYPPKAAHPSVSKHVWRPDDPVDQGARALDLPLDAEVWVRAWGRPHGWLADVVPGEHHHVEYDHPINHLPEGSDMALTDSDVLRIAEAVWRYSLPAASDHTVPKESAAARLSQVRRSTTDLRKRTTTTATNVATVLTDVSALTAHLANQTVQTHVLDVSPDVSDPTPGGYL